MFEHSINFINMEIITGQLSIRLSMAKHIVSRYPFTQANTSNLWLIGGVTCNGLGDMQFIGYSISWPKVDIGIECNIMVDKIFVQNIGWYMPRRLGYLLPCWLGVLYGSSGYVGETSTPESIDTQTITEEQINNNKTRCNAQSWWYVKFVQGYHHLIYPTS